MHRSKSNIIPGRLYFLVFYKLKIDWVCFKMKYALDRSLDGKKYETMDIGTSLERVMRYWTVRDKFNGVHPDLREIGVTRVSVSQQGLVFEMKQLKQ